MHRRVVRIGERLKIIRNDAFHRAVLLVRKSIKKLQILTRQPIQTADVHRVMKGRIERSGQAIEWRWNLLQGQQALLCPLEAAEEKQSIFEDRPAHTRPELLAVKRRRQRSQ